MKTFATLFTGGGGADIGAMQAGYKPLWGIEYVPEIAAVCRENLGHEVICKSILDVDPSDLEAPDWLHMSPPCPNFSVAKTDKGETGNDLALASKMAAFINVMRPTVVSVENVYGYRNSQSWQILLAELNHRGYLFDFWHLNAANYGVPQTRKRLVLVAKRAGVPVKPNATHAKEPAPLAQVTMFDTRLDRWVSWHEAIEDLIPELPESQFAPWQLKRLQKRDLSVMSQPFVVSDQPSFPLRHQGQPAQTITTNLHGGNPPRTFIASTHKGEWSDGYRDILAPAETVTNSANGRLKAFLMDRVNHSTNTIRYGNQPSQNVACYSPKHQAPNGIASGKVVAMTPRCLARFQSFPDWYELPEKKALACRIIGNAVPPLLMQRVIEAQ